jgi:hypothetical protein
MKNSSEGNKSWQYFNLIVVETLVIIFSFWLNKFLIFDLFESNRIPIYFLHGIFGFTLPKFGFFQQDMSIIAYIPLQPVFTCLLMIIFAYFISKIPVRNFFFHIKIVYALSLRNYEPQVIKNFFTLRVIENITKNLKKVQKIFLIFF